MKRQILWCVTAVVCAALIGGGIALHGSGGEDRHKGSSGGSRYEFLDDDSFPRASKTWKAEPEVGDSAIGVFDRASGRLWVKEWDGAAWRWRQVRYRDDEPEQAKRGEE